MVRSSLRVFLPGVCLDCLVNACLGLRYSSSPHKQIEGTHSMAAVTPGRQSWERRKQLAAPPHRLCDPFTAIKMGMLAVLSDNRVDWRLRAWTREQIAVLLGHESRTWKKDNNPRRNAIMAVLHRSCHDAQANRVGDRLLVMVWPHRHPRADICRDLDAVYLLDSGRTNE